MTDDPVSIEQRARDLLERLGVEDAQEWTNGDVLELANLINEKIRLEQEVELLRTENAALSAGYGPSGWISG